MRPGGRTGGRLARHRSGARPRPFSFVAVAKCSRCAYVCCRNCHCFSLSFLRVSLILEEILTGSLLFLGAESFGTSERTQVRSFLVVLQLANGVAWVEVGTVYCLFSWRDEDLVCYNKLFRKARAR